ncbi:LOW QUALITY PROTEIN: arg8-vasotocin receptor-like [Mobula birostris]|uniref:LOW QUALITY PROTEIN: arg8-vasotocin receptor-like n=1 Tax=Mobula birostris TaxID=1983395 RepID=UPI003B286E98
MKNLPFFLNGRVGGTDPSETLDIFDRNERLARAEAAVLAMIFVMATVGNSVLISDLWSRRKRRPRMYVFVMHLSIANLVVTVFHVLPQLLWVITEVFIGPDALCKMVAYLQLVGMLASTYRVMAMTFDRFQVVCYPMVTFCKGKAGWSTAICTSWVLSLILGVPQLFMFSKKEFLPGMVQCWAEFIQPWGSKAYVTWIFMVIFFIPTVILTTFQVKICRVIQMNIYTKTYQKPKMAKMQRVHLRVSNINCISKAMNKMVKMAVVMVLVYVLCWTPYFAVELWTVWYSSDITTGSAFTILMVLGNLNSCTSPWIYLYFCGQIPCCMKHESSCSVQEEYATTDSSDKVAT